jgi:glutathione synthase/RimK-type ligase-like ATP-grasp enzyme
MQILIVVNDPQDWTLSIPGVELVAARVYLTDPRYSLMRRVRVFNLCRAYRYQSVGYYVSLLGEARGHKPQPSVATIQDMKLQTLARLYSEDLDELIQHCMRPIRSNRFALSIYFGRNLAKRYGRLSLLLFNLFPAPLLRAHFVRDEEGAWRLQRIAPIPASEIPASHQAFVTEAAQAYFSGQRRRVRSRPMRYDMAILFNATDKIKPSNARAIDKFIKAGKQLSIDAQIVDKSAIGRIAEYDALFIRETTSVNHHTYRFSRRAAAEGLAVIDDPDSILKCTNKVYLAQLLERYKISAPKTLIIHRDNRADIVRELGLPCILKQPDSSFSQGVVKVSTEAQLEDMVERLLEKSELIVGQEYAPTDYDWRVGVIDGVPLYVCKYHMAKNHWQIVKHENDGETDYGKIETISLAATPKEVIDTAVKAAGLIGDGLYGVDLKQIGDRCHVIEVNDNPNVDASFEDAVLKEQLYLTIMESFLRRIENRSGRSPTHEKKQTLSI